MKAKVPVKVNVVEPETAMVFVPVGVVNEAKPVGDVAGRVTVTPESATLPVLFNVTVKLTLLPETCEVGMPTPLPDMARFSTNTDVERETTERPVACAVTVTGSVPGVAVADRVPLKV